MLGRVVAAMLMKVDRYDLCSGILMAERAELLGSLLWVNACLIFFFSEMSTHVLESFPILAWE